MPKIKIFFFFFFPIFSPVLTYNIQDEDLDKLLSLIQNVERKDLFKQGNSHTNTYMISHALSGTPHIEYFTDFQFYFLM